MCAVDSERANHLGRDLFQGPECGIVFHHFGDKYVCTDLSRWNFALYYGSSQLGYRISRYLEVISITDRMDARFHANRFPGSRSGGVTAVTGMARSRRWKEGPV